MMDDTDSLGVKTKESWWETPLYFLFDLIVIPYLWLKFLFSRGDD